jgi:hypothetical protein
MTAGKVTATRRQVWHLIEAGMNQTTAIEARLPGRRWSARYGLLRLRFERDKLASTK